MPTLSEKLLSIEMLASTIVTVFLLFGSWFSLSYASASNSESIADIKVVQQGVKEDIAHIKIDVAVLLDRQEKANLATKERLNDINESMKSTQRLIQQLHIGR